jgi:ribose transport system ATP-binding protein
MVSEDRKVEGLALGMSIADNLTLSSLPGLTSPSAQARSAGTWLDRLSVRFRSPHQPVADLSGGNQQKVALARLLHHDVDVLLLDEPTRGIDVASKAQIYALIDGVVSGSTGRAKAVVLVSSYLPELLGVCDRIAVMSRGRLAQSRPAAEWTEHALLMAASGAQAS